jgi:hypothetical protein
MNLANNVVLFPFKNIRIKPQTIEEVSDNLDIVRHAHIHETLDYAVSKLFETFELAGFPHEEDEELYNHAHLIYEACNSFLSKLSDINHPLQLIAENMFVNDDGGLRFSDKVKIVINPTEGKS